VTNCISPEIKLHGSGFSAPCSVECAFWSRTRSHRTQSGSPFTYNSTAALQSEHLGAMINYIHTEPRQMLVGNFPSTVHGTEIPCASFDFATGSGCMASLRGKTKVSHPR
jgi:hypothetical protein